MDNNNFGTMLSEYLMNHGWTRNDIDNKMAFRHGLMPDVYSSSTKIYKPKEILSRIEKTFIKRNLKEFHFESVINPYPDSDFIIAALQYINRFAYGNEKIDRELIYSFQPVIRHIPKGGSIKDGFLRSFINVGTVGVDQNINDYFEQLELWIDVLSICHIHISRVGISVKKGTTAYNGVGVELTVDGREVGQSNYYEIDFKDKMVGITDTGFGLEHICWAANKWTDFAVTFQSPLAYYLEYDDSSDLLNLIVLLIFSDIRPGANGYSAILRRSINELFKKDNIDYRPLVLFAVERAKRFLNNRYVYEDVLEIIDKEIERNICLDISRRYNLKHFEKLIGNRDAYCEKLLEGNILRG
jgi:hypothetical protein